MSSGIYNIRNIKNGKIYIGSAINIKNRGHVHINELENNKHHSKHLQHSWNKYGKNNFVFEVIEYTDVQNLLEREQFWIDNTNCLNDKIGYNKYPFAQCVNKDYIVSKETRKKLRKSMLGKSRPMWMKLQYGKPILQYTLDGVFIREWYAATEAERVTGIHRTGIKDALKGRATRKTAGGFIWKYKNSIDN